MTRYDKMAGLDGLGNGSKQVIGFGSLLGWLTQNICDR